MWDIMLSRQIIGTSHDLTPKVAKEEKSLISGKFRLVKYHNLSRMFSWKKNIKLNWCQLEFWSFSRHQGRWLYMGGNVGWWNMGFLCITKTLVVSLCLVVLDWRIQFGCNKTSGIIVVLWYQLQHYYCGKTTGMIWENQGWHHFRKLGVLPHRSTVATRIVTFFWIRGCTPWLHPRWRNCTSISWFSWTWY